MIKELSRFHVGKWNIPTDSLVSSTQKILQKKYFNEFPFLQII
jgi:hypothetical protein